MTGKDLSTEDSVVRLVSIDVERDARRGVEWLKGVVGRDTLRKMGVTDKYNHESTLAQERQRIHKILADPNELAWMIEVDGVIVGITETHLDDYGELPGPNVHIMIGSPAARGKGIGTTVLHAVLDYLQKNYEANSIYSRHLIDNYGSAALLTKLGFSSHGRTYTDADGLQWQNVVKTMPELFDVVDEYDQPTGKLITKQQAHTDGKIHRLVAVYVFDSDGRLFLQNHRSGYLDHSVGGHVTAGETYLDAAVREAAEELGLSGQKFEIVFSSWYSDESFCGSDEITPQQHFFTVYECHPTADWQFIPNEEVGSIVAADLERVVQQMRETPGKFTPGIINTMAKYIEVNGLPFAFDLPEIQSKWAKTR